MGEDFKQPAGHYAAHRPRYPRSLFAWLASISPDTRRAWDCATGAGQAALGLSEFFDVVLATDINQEQIDHAASNPKIKYSVAAAEDVAIESNSIDLVTVACGVHWFDRERFYATARRVLVPNGVVAVWTYTWPWTGSSSVDRILAILKHDILGAFWPEESKLYLSGYTEMDFPFEEIPTPNFALEFDWKVEELVGFLSTWSVWQRYLKKNGCSPLSLIEDDLKRAWSSSPPDKPLHLPLHFRVGRSV